MGKNCIAIRGDKGQAAELLNKPSLLFDDREDSIDLLRARSTPVNKLDGVVVRMGKKHRYNVARGYVANYRDDHWEGLVADLIITTVGDSAKMYTGLIIATSICAPAYRHNRW